MSSSSSTFSAGRLTPRSSDYDILESRMEKIYELETEVQELNDMKWEAEKRTEAANITIDELRASVRELTEQVAKVPDRSILSSRYEILREEKEVQDKRIQALESENQALLKMMRSLEQEKEERSEQFRRDTEQEISDLQHKLEEARLDSKTKVSDPSTPEGQRVGAILMIKNLSSAACGKHIGVGDCVEVLAHEESWFCKVQSLRHGTEAKIEWASFFPLGGQGQCHCSALFCNHVCLCFYKDPGPITKNVTVRNK